MISPAHILTERLIYISNKLDGIRRMNLAISGGSSPDILFFLWTGEYRGKIDWRNINLFWVDERCVNIDHPESNYGHAYKKFLIKTDIPDENIHRIKGENNPDKEAENYEKRVKEALGVNRGFDLVILGIGEDGHTSSVFPGQLELFETSRLYLPSTNPYNGQRRISLTLSGILNSKEISFFIRGSSKLKVIEEIIKRDKEEPLPAAYIINRSSNAKIYWNEAPAVAGLDINSIFVK